jgi:ferritin
MISNTMEEALNRQINRELYSAYLYLSMSAYFESIPMRGFAHWLRVQVREETTHAEKMYSYLIQAGGRARMGAIEEPKGEWKSPLDAFLHVAAHEKAVTGLINNLVTLAINENDEATNAMLQWFVKEQVEEEENAGDVVAKIQMIGDKPADLILLDHHLGKRI